MTQQEIVDQLEALKPKYEAVCVAATAGLDAERKSLQAACGEIGHIWKTNFMGFSRDRGCAVCGVWESRVDVASPVAEEGAHA
jgi:hypothetical protein